MNILPIARQLKAMPEDRRRMVVVRSMPFGDIIEDDTRKVLFKAPDNCQRWPKLAYEICQRFAKKGI